jgi:GT2 family glycosyltransferase
VGLDRALTRYAVFLDDDVILTEGWLERLRETMDRTGAGIVYARQLRTDGSPLSTSNACPNGEVAEALSGGACFMFRNDLGLRFDEYYVKSQWDDIDYAFEFYQRGYKSYVDGRVDFYHYNDPKIWRAQNLCYFIDKWTRKGLLRGWTLYKYEGDSALYPCFGPDVWAPKGTRDA